MPDAERDVYVDTSALVKLIVRERWSTELAVRLSEVADRVVTSALARVELSRAVRAARLGDEGEQAVRELLEGCVLVDVDADVLVRAVGLVGEGLGTLDAIHLATAQHAGLDRLLTYDRQLGRAAVAAGIAVEAPGAT